MADHELPPQRQNCAHGFHVECVDVPGCPCSCHHRAGFMTATISDADVLNREPRVLAHTDGPDTAKEAAAASTAPKATNRAHLLHKYAVVGPATTEYVWLTTPAGMDLAEIRRRATDLLAAGLLERTGRTRKTTSGRNAEVLKISDDGLRVLEALKEAS